MLTIDNPSRLKFMCCQYFSYSRIIRPICVWRNEIDDIAFFLYSDFWLWVYSGTTSCDVCGDTVIVRRFVCTVVNNADSFRNIHTYIYIYMLSIYDTTAPSGLWPSSQNTPVFPCFLLLHIHTHTHTHAYNYIHTHTHTYIYIYIYTDKSGYNDIGLYDTSSITSDILWYRSVPHC